MQLRHGPAYWQRQHQQSRQLVNVPQQQRCHIAHIVPQAPCVAVARAQHVRWLLTCTAAGSPADAVVTAAVRSGLSISTSAADPRLALRGIDAKSVGALLAAMCGNALGAQVEPEKHYRLSRMFPNGLHDMSWSFDISSSPLPAGHVTGDYAVMAAVAQSLVRRKAADALDMSDAMAASFDMTQPEQWYSPYSKLMLEGLAAGSNPFMLARHAEGYLASTASRASNTASHRPGRQLHGATDFTALARVIPVAVAYREAPLQELRRAAEAAVLLTHPSDTAADAAAVLAAAIAWCMRSDPASSSPSQLLEHLLTDVAVTQDMQDKLALLQDSWQALADLGYINSWTQFWWSKAWNDVTQVANLITKQNLANEATQATALALWVTLISWQHPKQAVMLAASLGGYAATTGTLVGSLAGALHGCEWIPAAWWDRLQEEPQAAVDDAGQRSGGQHSGEKHQHQDDADPAGDGGEAPAEQVTAQAGDGSSGEAGEEEPSEWMLRPVSKHSVVELGRKLAQLDCQQAAPIL